MLVFENEEIKFIKGYKVQCEREIIEIKDNLDGLKNNKLIPKPFIDKAENRLQDLEFLYNIFDKLENEVS